MSSQNSSDAEDRSRIDLAKNGDTEALDYFFQKYQPIMYWKATQYFLQGAERDDLLQEAMIGLFKAIRDFSPDKEASFRTFAEICINRQLLSAVKRSARQKNQPLNQSLSLDTPMTEEHGLDWTLLDVISEQAAQTPEDYLLKSEDRIDIAERLEKVTSPFEKEVLRCYLEGKSYQEMSDHFGKNIKAIDNALQRIKKKMGAQFD